MKIRNGFVSNSSSSSFIIGAKKEGEKAYLKLEVDLDRLSSKVVVDSKQLDEYMLQEYGWQAVDTIEELLKNEPWLKEQYFQALAVLATGGVVYFGRVGNEGNDYDNEIANYLYRAGFSGLTGESEDSIVIIQDSD